MQKHHIRRTGKDLNHSRYRRYYALSSSSPSSDALWLHPIPAASWRRKSFTEAMAVAVESSKSGGANEGAYHEIKYMCSSLDAMIIIDHQKRIIADEGN